MQPGCCCQSWLGRYRAIVAGVLIITAALLTFQASFVIFNFYWMLIPGFVIIGVISTGNLYTNMPQFTLDQLIGASAEEFSAAIQ